jgi:hypothetical protein
MWLLPPLGVNCLLPVQKESLVCFASIRFQHCQITLPLFERDWQSLKLHFRQNSLPKVQFAIKTLPTDFFVFFRKRQALCARQMGSCSRLYLATRQGYLARKAHSPFRAA